MKPNDKLKEIESKWIHSKMDYTDSRWLIDRVKKLTEALEDAETDFCVLEQYEKAKIVEKALESE